MVVVSTAIIDAPSPPLDLDEMASTREIILLRREHLAHIFFLFRNLILFGDMFVVIWTCRTCPVYEIDA